jgi:hypothetical protein
VGCESADRQSIAAQQQKVGEENAKRDKEEFDSTKAQLLRDLNNDVTPGSANTSGAPLTPGPLRNIPAKVLENRQPDVAEVDRKIKQAQEALYRLIHSNQQSDDQRMEWTADSLDASEDAEKLSLNLVLDLIGAHVDYLADVNKEERAEVLDQLLSRSEAQSQGKSLHNIYGMMVDRKEELERIHSEVDLIGKENDLRGKLDDLEEANDSEFTREDMFDIVMNIKDAVGVLAHKEFPAAVNLAGPAKDLLDSAYVIWKQAASMSRLSQIQGVQEQNLKAAASLRQYILKLEKQKQKAKTGAAGQVSAKPM